MPHHTDWMWPVDGGWISHFQFATKSKRKVSQCPMWMTYDATELERWMIELNECPFSTIPALELHDAKVGWQFCWFCYYLQEDATAAPQPPREVATFPSVYAKVHIPKNVASKSWLSEWKTTSQSDSRVELISREDLEADFTETQNKLSSTGSIQMWSLTPTNVYFKTSGHREVELSMMRPRSSPERL